MNSDDPMATYRTMSSLNRNNSRPKSIAGSAEESVDRLDTSTSEDKIFITSDALAGIFATIGSRTPEAGGILMGPIGRDGISDFIFDDQGNATSVTYSPSDEELTSLCEDAAAKAGKEMKGFCHSHPGGYGSPSGGDMTYVRRFFEANPGMMKFYMPILVHAPLDGSRSGATGRRLKKIRGKSAKEAQPPADWTDHLKFYVVYRSNQYVAQLLPVEIAEESEFQEIEVEDTDVRETAVNVVHLSLLRRMLCGYKVSQSVVRINGISIACISVTDDETEITVMLPTEFPVMQPSVLITRPGSGSYQYRFCWAIDEKTDLHSRLAELIKTAASAKLTIF
jgi:proteasome lid subunit RPN8/RPN11